MDVAEPQVIVEYPNDTDGYFWHHRVLLQRVAAGVWVCLTPDHELKRYDLNVHEHMILGRNTSFPAGQAPYVYAHDPLSRAALSSFQRQAKVMVGVLGGTDDVVEVGESPWVMADPRIDLFG